MLNHNFKKVIPIFGKTPDKITRDVVMKLNYDKEFHNKKV